MTSTNQLSTERLNAFNIARDRLAVDQLLYEYFVIVRHGETTHRQKHVEWFLNESATGTVTVSYKEGSTWVDDRYSDELPPWLLMSILRAIERCKPLGDAKADETIKKVRDLEAAYVRTKREKSLKVIKLNTRPSFFKKEPLEES